MTQKNMPSDIFPAALRKIFDERNSGPLNLSKEEVREAQLWKAQLDLDILAAEETIGTH